MLLVAAALRLRPLIELDRFGLMAYDENAYFLAGRAVTLGYVPYADFAFVQPPGVIAALAPFSLFATWGFTAAKVVVALLGALSAALLWRIVRPWYGPVAALVASLAYALFRSSIAAHRTC